MLYDVFKSIHLIGVVVLLGNVTVTAFWKVFADRTRDPRIVAHAQYLVTVTDWFFTVSSILLVAIGGFGAAYVADISVVRTSWVVIGEALFVVSGMMWLLILVPVQIRQAKMARTFADADAVPDEYRRDARIWLKWGLIATVPLVAALYVMVAKP